SPAWGASNGAGGLRLLLVDDNVDSARTLAMLLELSGHEVQVVHGGAPALEAMQKGAPDCVLLDIGMPEMNGYEVARRLRSDHKFRGELVALTGFGRDYDREQAHLAGFDHYLVKPVDYQKLQLLLEQFATAGSHKGASTQDTSEGVAI
ncbi:MAG: response regulator, partial [Gammaproteobacteria bacterium]|nr:response regulator [Gammaproteobacteria bacterium]